MTTTVLSADGTPVHLSPTGENALRRMWIRRSVGYLMPRESVHGATAAKLLAAGLIATEGELYRLTAAGVAAVESLPT